MHEILTIQCGNTANYIGTHFWNFQEPTSENQSEINHDVLFSSGQARNGNQTYTPRVLLYDTARHFGSMSRMNALFEEPRTETTDLQVISSERIPDHPFQTSLEESVTPDGGLLSVDNVRYWSDYNTQFYRPQSYLPLNAFAETTQLDDFDAGRGAWKSRTQRSDILDTDLRPFLEECDLLQGINLVSCLIDGWGGWTTELVLELASEFPKVPRLLFSTTAATTRPENLNLSNVLLGIHDEVDALIPFDATGSWSGSAHAATWIDAFTVPFRTKEASLTVSDVTSFLTPGHRIFNPTLTDRSLGPIAQDRTDRRFSVVRGQREIELESKLVNGSLVTTYRDVSTTEYPTSFPDSLRLDNVVASLEDSSWGCSQYLAQIRKMVGGIKGAKGYSDRKEIVEELVELEGRYKTELMESEASSDEDGF
ncbi:Protein dml-1 [Taphrina deformans PYCC 5710]|uniref:Protein dml-1 n=1 Tax=Taphrina deformans (strain PYCC 5710 / ATCC 11124 / CBS 356.35 / IMI 108563 / JCM 9778 / NBRC 8474) TaxID=1097556 RepID=R4XAG3_TAPDE|nr:Protein dml-1 [Taphrina deformans PYCC 5710]|eukprot:CCG81272.1 Protein dml-1 [Taphrina deformans PYCC 5710]